MPETARGSPRRRRGRRQQAAELGVIHYSRGQITVLNRKKLEQLCCECYAMVKRETDRLLAPQHSA